MWIRLVGGALLAGIAFGLTISLGLPERGSTFLLLFPTVVAAAYLAGRDAGLAAIATGAVLVGVRIILRWEEAASPWTQVSALLVFIVFGAGIALLLSRLKQTLRDLEAANFELENATRAARRAEEETDLLLRELRHRVRNDISNLIAILRLQANRCAGDAAAQLSGAADRLEVLAKVHRRLSRQGHSPVVEMKGFIDELCTELRSTLVALKAIAIQTDIEPMELGSTRAVSVGLIVNELVTNATKYAFPDDREGVIRVEMRRSGHEVELSVCDDGIGTPSEEAVSGGSGLGQRLVRSLAAQLGGSFQCDVHANGMHCVVRFPDEKAAATR